MKQLNINIQSALVEIKRMAKTAQALLDMQTLLEQYAPIQNALAEGEELFAYMIRLFPSFLEVLEVWSPINAPSAAEVLRLAEERSAQEMAEVEISLEDWFGGTRH